MYLLTSTLTKFDQVVTGQRVPGVGDLAPEQVQRQPEGVGAVRHAARAHAQRAQRRQRRRRQLRPRLIRLLQLAGQIQLLNIVLVFLWFTKRICQKRTLPFITPNFISRTVIN